MKKYSSLLFFAVIIIAIFFRFYNFKTVPPGLYPDEAMNGSNALEAIETGQFKAFYPENNGREGLFINIQAISIKIFGNHPWALRAVSGVFGVLTVIAVYLLGTTLFKNKKIGLWAAFFCSISFWHVNFSRIGFRAIMAPFFLTITFYFLIKAMRLVANGWKKYLGFSAIAGFFFGLGFHSYIAYRAMPLLALIAFIYFFVKEKNVLSRKRIAQMFLIFVVFAAIAASSLIIYFAQNPADFFGRTSQISVFGSPTMFKDLSFNIVKTLGMFNFIGDGNWRHNYASRPELALPVGLLFITGIILIFKKRTMQYLEEEKRFPLIFLLSWFAVAALPVVISNEGLPHALRAILMIPPAMILAGLGAFWAYEKLKKFSPVIAKGSAAGLIVFLLVHAYITYFILWSKNKMTGDYFAANYVKIAEQINSLPKETPKYVVVEAGGTDVRGIPMPSQTVMFLTDTFTKTGQTNKNVIYLLPTEELSIPEEAAVFRIN